MCLAHTHTACKLETAASRGNDLMPSNSRTWQHPIALRSGPCLFGLQSDRTSMTNHLLLGLHHGVILATLLGWHNPIAICIQVGQGGMTNGLHGLHGKEGLMCCQHHIVEGSQGRDVIFQHHLLAPIAKEVCVLILNNIQASTTDYAFSQTSNERLGVYQATTGGIDDDHSLLHLADGIHIDCVLGLSKEWCMQADYVTCAEELILTHILDAQSARRLILDLWVLIHITGNDIAAKSILEDARGDASNQTCSNNAYLLTNHVKAKQAIQLEVATLGCINCLRNSSVH
mmetsp:Transcript_43678/g.100800  ORF Transcript_43678/g.100800 Transcript_43678/m.100800 type:complete len:287 (-) Transcript_43678:1841-2701(-)